MAIVVSGVAGSGRQLLLFFLLFCVASFFCFCPLYFSVSFVSYGEGVIVDNWEDSGSWWWLCGRQVVRDGYSPFLSCFSLSLLPCFFCSLCQQGFSNLCSGFVVVLLFLVDHNGGFWWH